MSRVPGVPRVPPSARGARTRPPSAAAWMAAAAAQLGHALRFLAVLGTVLSEFTVRGDRAGTTGVGALLRLVHEASCSWTLPGNCRTGRTIRHAGSPRYSPGAAVVRGRSGASLGPLGLRRGVALGRPPRIALALGPQNAAPFLVLGYWHPALDADVDPLARFGVA